MRCASLGKAARHDGASSKADARAIRGAFNIHNKKDPADTRAIWLAVQQPGKPVAVKTEIQQAMLALHRMREQLVKFRTMQINALRGLLTEYGEVMGEGRLALDRGIPDVLARFADRLPAALT